MPIDVHAHYIPPRILAVLREHAADYGVALSAAGTPPCLSFEYGLALRPFIPRLIEEVPARIAHFTAVGIDRQILSVWSDILGYGLPPAKGGAWHRLLNDELAELCQRYPERFSFLASGPLNDPARAARELSRAVREGAAVGGLVAANLMEVNLGEADLDEYWAAAVELDVPVFIHPTQPQPGARTKRWTMTQVVQFTYDTTLAAASLIFAGVMDRFPTLELILPHGGGLMPYLIGRFDHMHQHMDRNAEGDLARALPSAYVQRFYYDTIVHNPRVLRFLIDSVSAGRLVLGSDDPFPPGVRDPMQILRDAQLAPDQVAVIADDNPRRLFKRLG